MSIKRSKVHSKHRSYSSEEEEEKEDDDVCHMPKIQKLNFPELKACLLLAHNYELEKRGT